jgi:hypothetical protein
MSNASAGASTAACQHGTNSILSVSCRTNPPGTHLRGVLWIAVRSRHARDAGPRIVTSAMPHHAWEEFRVELPIFLRKKQFLCIGPLRAWGLAITQPAACVMILTHLRQPVILVPRMQTLHKLPSSAMFAPCSHNRARGGHPGPVLPSQLDSRRPTAYCCTGGGTLYPRNTMTTVIPRPLPYGAV